MGYMGILSYCNIPKAIFYLLKGDYRTILLDKLLLPKAISGLVKCHEKSCTCRYVFFQKTGVGNTMF